MKKLLAGILVLMLLIACFGCGAKPAAEETGDSDWAYIQGNGTLKIGITIYEPMNYYDEAGALVGFDTEFAEAVCEKLGLTPEFIEINWDTKEIELDAGNIDCIWNGLTVTEERRQNMEFTDSYIRNMQVVVIRAADAGTYTDTASLAGGTVVAEISSAGETAIADDASLSQASYVAMAKQTDALLEVKSGTADAAVLDYVLAKSMVGEGTDYADLMILPGVELAVEEYAIGFRLGSDAVAEVNAAIAELIAEGTLDEIAVTYDLTASLLSNQ